MKWVNLSLALANRNAKIMTVSQTLNLSAIGPNNPASNSHPLAKPMMLCRCANKQILNAMVFGYKNNLDTSTTLKKVPFQNPAGVSDFSDV